MTDARRLTRPRAQKKARRRAPDTAKSPDAFVELVRFSRAGDQFHYLWAARRILKLIDPHATLVAVAIEGVSKLEAGDFEATRAGEAVVDLTEYAGNERLEAAAEVRYVQLKHSTQRADEALGAAGLADTLRGFAQRYAAQRRAHGDPVADKLRFEFVTNRPIEPRVLESVADLVAGDTPRHARTAKALVGYVKLDSKHHASGAPCSFAAAKATATPSRLSFIWTLAATFRVRISTARSSSKSWSCSERYPNTPQTLWFGKWTCCGRLGSRRTKSFRRRIGLMRRSP